MAVQQTPCDRQSIERFLTDRLSAVEQASLETHLGDCPACRQCLDDLAADGPWWQEARGYLSGGEPAASGAARQRFAREAKAAAAVMHDNVIAIHTVAESNGLPYFVMPYVSGPSLEKRLRQSGALAPVEVVRIGRQIAAGLAAAHAQ